MALHHTNLRFLFVMGLLIAPVLISSPAQCGPDPLEKDEVPPAVERPAVPFVPPSSFPDNVESERERVRRRIDMLRIWRLTSELNLDEPTARKLFPVLHAFQVRRSQLRSECNRIEKKLALELRNEQRNGEKIKSLIEAYKQNELKKYELYQEEARKLEDVLTPRQYAQYILFAERFNLELQYIFREALGRNKPSVPSNVQEPSENGSAETASPPKDDGADR